MKNMKLINKLFLIVLLSVLFTACGGGGGGKSSGPSGDLGTVSVFVTDSLSQDFKKAWITIKKVTINDTGGVEHTLYDDASGKVFNLLELSGIGQLLNVSTLPPGSYNKVRITVANQINLVDNSGQTISAKFSSSGTDYIIDVNGNLTVIAGQRTSFGIDFDTKQFTYNAQTGIVTATVIFKSESELHSLDQMYAEVKGYVKDVTGTSTFTMQTDSGLTISVTLHQTAVVVDENTGAKTTDTSILKSGQRVDVYGDYDHVNLTMTAISVKIEKTSGNIGQAVKAKGIVTAINGSIITLDVKDADHFIPPSNTINIDISQAIFSKGNISMLSNGQWIEVKGSWNGSILSASIIEIEGASVGDGDHGNVSYVEVKGSVQSVNGNLITLTIYSYEHFTPPSNIVQADVSKAYYKHGSYSNLTPGVFVEVKGSWNGSLIIASIVEFKD